MINTKRCYRCRKTKPLTGFSRKKKNLLQSLCKICQNKNNKAHYKHNKAAYIKRIYANHKANRAWLTEYKTDKPCMDCGIVYHPVVMDFDHRDSSKKKRNISLLISWSRQVILQEIAKCDLVCSNCHRMRTLKRSGIV